MLIRATAPRGGALVVDKWSNSRKLPFRVLGLRVKGGHAADSQFQRQAYGEICDVAERVAEPQCAIGNVVSGCIATY